MQTSVVGHDTNYNRLAFIHQASVCLGWAPCQLMIQCLVLVISFHLVHQMAGRVLWANPPGAI